MLYFTTEQNCKLIQCNVFLMKHIGFWGKFTADRAVPNSKSATCPHGCVLSVRLINISAINILFYFEQFRKCFFAK